MFVIVPPAYVSPVTPSQAFISMQMWLGTPADVGGTTPQPSAAAEQSPYSWFAKWVCTAPCTVTYSIDSSYPARSAQLVRETMADISAAPEIDFVEGNGNAKVKWETCESAHQKACGFLTYPSTGNNPDYPGNDKLALRSATVVIDTTSWDQLIDLKGYLCHEALHTVGFAHAPRYEPSCFNGTSPTYQPGVEDYTLISMMYPLGG